MVAGPGPSRRQRIVGTSAIVAGLAAGIRLRLVVLTISILWQQRREAGARDSYAPAAIILAAVALAATGIVASVLQGLDRIPGGRAVLVAATGVLWIVAVLTGFSVGLYLVPSAVLATYASIAARPARF